MWFDQADVNDLTLLAQYDVWGGVPAIPLRLPGLGRYGRYQFDRTILLQRNDLTVAQRREVMFLADHFHRIDHFEFFELGPDADERALRKAFFHFSKRFHPDVLREKNLGAFTEHAQLVFEYGQQANELLTTDESFRQAYARVTRLRDDHFRHQLEEERNTQRKRLNEAKQKGVLPPSSHLRDKTTATSHDRRSEEERAARKSLLRERLAKNQTRRKGAEDQRQNADLDAQARTFFLSGEQAERRGQLARALNHFKLCVEYRPTDQRYVEALRRVEATIAENEAAKLWAEASDMTASGDELQSQAAFDLYLQACELSPNDRRLVELSQHALEHDQTERVLQPLLKGIEGAPFNLDLKWALAQVYEVRRELGEAKELVEEMLSFDPSEPRATRFKKRYN